MVNDEYEMSGHIIVPYNKKTEQIFFKQTTSISYSLYKNGIKLENTTRLPKKFIDKYLLSRGYEIKPWRGVVLSPLKKVNGISVGVTKIKKDTKIVELLISVHAKDMRSLLKNCDSVVEYVEVYTGKKIKDHAKLWTKQELC